MKIQLSSVDIVNTRTDCLIIGIKEKAEQSATVRKIEKATNRLVEGVLDSGDFNGRPGSTIVIPKPQGINAKRLLLVGIGDKPDADDFAAAASAAARELCKTRSISAVSTLAEISVSGLDNKSKARLVVQSIHNARYRFIQLKTMKGKARKDAQCALTRMSLQSGSTRNETSLKEGIREGTAIGNGVALAKRLSDLPGNLCTPSFLASEAKKLVRTHGLKVQVLDEAKMKALKMG
ncbi:MAG: M17 family peptidase N-terminal domain-containing protein, partial [Arenicellales bacterium]|nr:M17 family peptidase N-terminal domain-containing protein [Arenicellales bacterium]